jgi:hypothetical protein
MALRPDEGNFKSGERDSDQLVTSERRANLGHVVENGPNLPAAAPH